MSSERRDLERSRWLSRGNLDRRSCSPGSVVHVVIIILLFFVFVVESFKDFVGYPVAIWTDALVGLRCLGVVARHSSGRPADTSDLRIGLKLSFKYNQTPTLDQDLSFKIYGWHIIDIINKLKKKENFNKLANAHHKIIFFHFFVHSIRFS